MKKFRNWIFKLLTGYDLLDYEEILKFAASVNKNGDEILKLARNISNDNKEIHNDNKVILEHNKKVIETNQRVLDISHKIIEDCRSILLLCQEVNTDETLG